MIYLANVHKYPHLFADGMPVSTKVVIDSQKEDRRNVWEIANNLLKLGSPSKIILKNDGYMTAVFVDGFIGFISRTD